MTLERDAMEFSKLIESKTEPKAARDLFATISVSGGSAYARIDGSDELTPIVSGVTVHHGDRVMVKIVDHRCIVTQNITVPSVNDSQYEHVKDIAEEANTLLDGVAEAAAEAEKTVAEMLSDADTAASTLSGMQEAAQAAGTTLNGIYQDAEDAADAAQAAQDSLKSVVRGATTVEKAVSVMQTALEAVVDYDPDNDDVQEWFWHDANGAHVLGDTSGYRNDIDSSGMNIVEVSDERSVAQFGADGARIGKPYNAQASDNESHLDLDYHSMQLVDREGDTYFHVSDLRDKNGFLTDVFSTWDMAETYTVRLDVLEVISVKLDGSEVPYSRNGKNFTLAACPPTGGRLEIVYLPATTDTKAYTFGIRRSGYEVGLFSVAEGYNTIAKGDYSHVEGKNSSSSGVYSHAEGQGTHATDACAHSEGSESEAEGLCSHAEGSNTRARGTASHTEGAISAANGSYSHAQNLGTKASSDSQTAIGKYNEEDANDEYALIIGNGTSDNARSNALAVRWNGLVDQAGETAYPTFTRSSWSTSSDESTLPVTPCFVLDTSDNALYWCSGNGITRLNPVYAAVAHNHDSAYVNITGDTMTGQLKFKDGNALPNAGTSTDFFAVGMNAFANGGRLAYKGLADFKAWLGLAALAYKASLAAGDIPNLDAGKITSGTFAAARIPTLSQTKIEPIYYQAKGSGNLSMTAGTITKVTLVTSGARYDGTGLSIASGGIKIATAGRYRVTAGAYVQNTAAAATGHGVYVKYATDSGAFSAASEILAATETHAGGSAGGVFAGPKIFQCAANSILYLAARSMGAAGTCDQDNESTYLLVERLS